MERIVQLKEGEYGNLIEKANLNEKQINEQAQFILALVAALGWMAFVFHLCMY